MIQYKDQTFRKLFDRGEMLTLESFELVNCVFENCAISLTKDVGRCTTVRNTVLTRCSFNGCGVGPVVMEDVAIDGLAINDLLLLWSPVFHHVTFSGDIGKMKVNPWAHFVDRTKATQNPFDARRERAYETMDWALDIRRARFKLFEIGGVPARLFRRDPESQVVVTRDRALSSDWKSHAKAKKNPWLFSIELFLSDGYQDTVLVAPLAAPKAKRDAMLKGLGELRDVGIAQPE